MLWNDIEMFEVWLRDIDKLAPSKYKSVTSPQMDFFFEVIRFGNDMKFVQSFVTVQALEGLNIVAKQD